VDASRYQNGAWLINRVAGENDGCDRLVDVYNDAMAWLDGRNSSRATEFDREIRTAIRHLRRRDPVVRALIDRFGPYELRGTRSAFQVMLETIVSQQLSTHAARAIYGRLAAAAGGRVPTAASVLALSDAELLACGLSRSKVVYARNVATAFASHRLDRRAFGRTDDEGVMQTLTAIKGVGEWSAHMFLIFALNRLDVFPVGDLGLRKAMAARYGLRRNVRASRYHRIADAWRPYRTIGTLYLWRSYDGL
jgi:DNA-3-methyladenine glycosylase II